ncbi:SDR family oxidoreductase [Fulvivirga lutea]|uniref:SDR family oxidoreductase n=1 Tax=Fulvivirga lutea TaxID=2810512 RepID=A0A974WFL5_9BACT|nr:SDR family oxidoreductase [Fulvivirga lutea]QSE97095.1 SDR family oxidoreductase [Fulvivirga lutea]
MKKIALVTGGTKGIGKALIETFSENGFDIVTCSRSESDLEKLKKEIEDRFKNVLEYSKVDMSKKEEVQKFADEVLKKYPSIDVLINNAGVFIPGQIHEEEEGILEKMIDTNLYSAYHLTRKIVPSMKNNKHGHIFNICSTASFMAYSNGGSYCISKFALLGFSKVLRVEMQEFGVRVTSIMPGATMSASWEGVDIPEERFMPASDVASAVYNAYTMSERTVVEELVLRPQLGDI